MLVLFKKSNPANNSISIEMSLSITFNSLFTFKIFSKANINQTFLFRNENYIKYLLNFYFKIVTFKKFQHKQLLYNHLENDSIQFLGRFHINGIC